MKLPKDQDNWTGHHAEKALATARREFDRYEARINFDWPQERQDECYRPYRFAREEAIMVCQVTRWRVREAEALP